MDENKKLPVMNQEQVIIPELVYSNVTEIIDSVEEPLKILLVLSTKNLLKVLIMLLKARI